MKTWQLVTIITLSVIMASLVTASVLVLLNQPKTNTFSSYTNYPNGASGNNAYPYSSANPQTITPGNLTNPVNPPTITTISNAVAIAQNYIIRLNNPDLAVRQVEEYSQNFYVQVYERSTGVGAFELMIDKNTGSVYPETGPNTAWNTKYGTASSSGYGASNGYGGDYGPGPGMMQRIFGQGDPMGNFFGGGATNTNTAATMTPYQAQTYAQQYINSNYPGTTTGQITAFYGYYTINVLSGGNSVGMISVNDYTGQVWYHTWHGNFIQELNVS